MRVVEVADKVPDCVSMVALQDVLTIIIDVPLLWPTVVPKTSPATCKSKGNLK